MTESILQPSQIKLFGRLFKGLTLVPPDAEEVEPNSLANTDKEKAKRKNNGDDGEMCDKESELPAPVFKEPPVPQARFDLLTNQVLREDSTLARIYGFTYEGEYYDLPRPTVYMVHGIGRAIDKNLSGELDRSGVAARDWAFESDVRYWEYDRINYSLRCDIVSGTLEDILIEACMNSDDNETSNADMAARSTVSSRSTVSARSTVASRSTLNARHRMR